MKTLRGLVAVIGGLAVPLVLVPLLESPLVRHDPGSAGGPLVGPTTLALAHLLFTGIASILGGYVTARIAAHDPMRYTTVAAALQAVILIAGIVAGYANPTPLWVQIALVVVAPLGILAGGAVRSAVGALPQNRPNE